MDRSRLSGSLEFLREAERLKDVLRSAHTSSGRMESTAEHTWRLCLMAMVFEPELSDVDFTKLLKIAVIHDLGEALNGDIPAPQAGARSKSIQERQDLEALMAPLAADQRNSFLALWDEYDQASSPEARLVKGLDKLETILQHTQGQNPADFDYAFNLAYGRNYTEGVPLLAAIRKELDEKTRQLHEAGQQAAARNP